MKKLNNKGFTLTELLATLAVLSLVSTIVIYVAINVVNSAKDKSYLVTRNNVEKAAVSYLEENSDKIHFFKYKNNIEYQCIIVQNLIDTNYFDKDVLNSKISNDNTISDIKYIYIERDSTSKTIKNSKLITNSDSDYSTICGDYNSRLEGDIEFKIPEGFAKEKDVSIKYCLYNVSDYKNISYEYIYIPSENSNFIEQYDEDNCLIKNIKVLGNGDLNARIESTNIDKTTSITGIDREAPSINIEPNGDKDYSKSKTINISISDNLSGISSDSTIKYGFSKSKSEEPSSYKEVNVSTGNVKVIESSLTGEYYLWIKPSVKDNVGNENNSTLVSDIYKFDNTAPSIPTYIAKYRDGSGSYTSGSDANSEVVTDISTTEADSGIEGIYYSKDKKNFIRFDFLESNLKQNGNTWSGTESWDFRNGRDDSYYFRACDNVGNCSDVSELFNIKYVTQVYIKYNANGGSMASNHGSGYAVNSSGMITNNGEELVTKVEYGKKLGSSGLYNVNNSSYVNLVKGVYSIYSGSEWCTGTSGNGMCYDQDKQYNASDFCDASNKDCNVTLYANWLGYYCSYTGETYATYSEAKSACTVTTSTNSLSKTTTTYSCPSGYTCSGGTCTSTSTCEKTVNGTITTKYYCSHNGSYQDSSSCSYRAGERTYSCNLTCSGSGSCTYTCPSNSAKNGTTCYYYDTSCGSGWTKADTGTCYFHCAMLTQGVSKAIECDGIGSCSVSKMYCTASDGTTIRDGGSTLNSGCYNRGIRYQCSKPATASSGCNKVYSAGSCTVKSSTGSCASGYTTTETTCTNKIDKDGKKYCDTRDYWKGKSCTANYDNGATKKVDLTCSKTGTKKYYCSSTGKYTDSEPSTCSSTITEKLISTSNISYYCPDGYSSSETIDQNSKCTKTEVYNVY